MIARLRHPAACALLLILAASSCDKGKGDGDASSPPCEGDRESCTEQVVAGWLEGADAKPWQGGAPEHPVAIYADRSRSMRGFLDPAYPNTKDYRSVIDGLQARLAPRKVYGFGNAVRLEANAGLDVLGNRDFYSDGNTEMEEALDTIAADSQRAWSHLVVGDARRTDPNLANRQFVRMRDLAMRWTEKGGIFLVAVSPAPFRPVPGDPSGCHAPSAASAQADSAWKCPLYAFAFAAPGDGMRVAGALTELFQHVWAFPIPTAPGNAVALRADGAPQGVTFDPAWLAGGEWGNVPKIEAEAPATQPLRLKLEPAKPAENTGRLLAAMLAGQETRATLTARAVSADAQAASWSDRDGRTGPVRLAQDGRGLEVYSPGGDDCAAAEPADPCGTLYRLELRPAGVPAWLAAFDAREAADQERTFGLGRLFESFQARAAGSAPPLARAYLLVR